MKRELPPLKDGQDWCCGGCGSGIVNPKQTNFEYSREELPNGDVISKTEIRYVAPCCGGDLLLWDDDEIEFVTWSYVEKGGAQ